MPREIGVRGIVFTTPPRHGGGTSGRGTRSIGLCPPAGRGSDDPRHGRTAGRHPLRATVRWSGVSRATVRRTRRPRGIPVRLLKTRVSLPHSSGLPFADWKLEGLGCGPRDESCPGTGHRRRTTAGGRLGMGPGIRARVSAPRPDGGGTMRVLYELETIWAETRRATPKGGPSRGRSRSARTIGHFRWHVKARYGAPWHRARAWGRPAHARPQGSVLHAMLG